MTWRINSKTRAWISSALRMPLMDATVWRNASRTVSLEASYHRRFPVCYGTVPALLSLREFQQRGIDFLSIEKDKYGDADLDAVGMHQHFPATGKFIDEGPAFILFSPYQ